MLNAMAPLIVLVAAFVVFRGLGFAVPWLADGQHALRAALGAMFLLTASAHWGKRRADLVRMVPAGMGDAGLWVTLTGVAEIATAVGLQIPQLAFLTAAAAIVMLCCLFPANAKAAREHMAILGKPVLPLTPRLLIQIVFVGALAAAGWRR